MRSDVNENVINREIADDFAVDAGGEAGELSTERNILATNDDGMAAEGVWHLADAMRDYGRVIVVAPAREASGTGTMVTQRRDLRIKLVASRVLDVKAYTVDGTPADCVLAGLRHLKEGWISVIASGINHGFNLGTDFFFSGTCDAAKGCVSPPARSGRILRPRSRPIP